MWIVSCELSVSTKEAMGLLKTKVEEGFGYQINLCRDRGLYPGPPTQKSDTLPLDRQGLSAVITDPFSELRAVVRRIDGRTAPAQHHTHVAKVDSQFKSYRYVSSTAVVMYPDRKAGRWIKSRSGRRNFRLYAHHNFNFILEGYYKIGETLESSSIRQIDEAVWRSEGKLKGT
uniref:Uncharacterized protein n=1 Tax=Timema poppense TaxID=170557 RepID=A0A7R9H4V8_TIMPO|nr:unnamed protein product [Timema poppensis]